MAAVSNQQPAPALVVLEFDNPPPKPDVCCLCCYFEAQALDLDERRVVVYQRNFQSVLTCEVPARFSLWDKIKASCGVATVAPQPDYAKAITNFGHYFDQQHPQLLELTERITAVKLETKKQQSLLVREARQMIDTAQKCAKIKPKFDRYLAHLRYHLLFQEAQPLNSKLPKDAVVSDLFVQKTPRALERIDDDYLLESLKRLTAPYIKESSIKEIIAVVKYRFAQCKKVVVSQNELSQFVVEELKGRHFTIVLPLMMTALNMQSPIVSSACHKAKVNAPLAMQELALFYRAIMDSEQQAVEIRELAINLQSFVGKKILRLAQKTAGIDLRNVKQLTDVDKQRLQDEIQKWQMAKQEFARLLEQEKYHMHFSRIVTLSPLAVANGRKLDLYVKNKQHNLPFDSQKLLAELRNIVIQDCDNKQIDENQLQAIMNQVKVELEAIAQDNVIAVSEIRSIVAKAIKHLNFKIPKPRIYTDGGQSLKDSLLMETDDTLFALYKMLEKPVTAAPAAAAPAAGAGAGAGPVNPSSELDQKTD